MSFSSLFWNSGNWELQHQGTGSHGAWWEHTSRFAHGFLLAVSSHGQEKKHQPCLLTGYQFCSSEFHFHNLRASLVAQTVKRLPAMRETQVRFLIYNWPLNSWVRGFDPFHIGKAECSFTSGLPYGSVSSNSNNHRYVALYVFIKKKKNVFLLLLLFTQQLLDCPRSATIISYRFCLLIPWHWRLGFQHMNTSVSCSVMSNFLRPYGL